LRWAKVANCAPTDETFVGTELTGVMTGVIFARTGGSCAGRFATETIEKPISFVETSGMIGGICAPIVATCAMIVVTSGMTVAASDATTEGKVSSVPGGGPRERRLASPAAAFSSCEQRAPTDEQGSVRALRCLRLGVSDIL
jgi:hypothetical protein